MIGVVEHAVRKAARNSLMRTVGPDIKVPIKTHAFRRITTQSPSDPVRIRYHPCSHFLVIFDF